MLELKRELESQVIHPSMRQSFFIPIETFLENRGKRFRAECVRIGAMLAEAPQERAQLTENVELALSALMEAIETIHAGSLIIDDIQDGSDVRRGTPALHCKMGLPLALNAGNWLYFWPMEWIMSLRLPERVELKIYRAYHSTLSRAHLGQAIDLGASMDSISPIEIQQLCLRSLELKTGALMSLAFELGGIINDIDDGRLEFLREFGKRLGTLLQIFDDLGNLSRTSDRRFEDLKNMRPSFVWWAAAEVSSDTEFKAFVHAVHELQKTAHSLALTDWLERTDFLCKAKRLADEQREQTLRFFKSQVHEDSHPHSSEWVQTLVERIKFSYGN